MEFRDKESDNEAINFLFCSSFFFGGFRLQTRMNIALQSTIKVRVTEIKMMDYQRKRLGDKCISCFDAEFALSVFLCRFFWLERRGDDSMVRSCGCTISNRYTIVEEATTNNAV